MGKKPRRDRDEKNEEREMPKHAYKKKEKGRIEGKERNTFANRLSFARSWKRRKGRKR